MENAAAMHTRIYLPEPQVFRRAAAMLARGEVVALPTETVYGLAGHALDPGAAIAIFRAKERPLFDPLIVHLPDETWLERLTRFESQAQAGIVARLCARYWPGPLTLVLPRKLAGGVPDIVTAGSLLVAVRMSAHPVFHELMNHFGQPLAAPSANRFGRISPTRAEHVLEELNGRIEMIIDGGPAEHGLESTIVQPDADGRLAILRHGPITAEELDELAPVISLEDRGRPQRVVMPGTLPGHYAPRTPLRMLANPASSIPKDLPPGGKFGLLCLRLPPEGTDGWHAVECLSRTGDLKEAAIHLFAALRRLDNAGLDVIVAEPVPAVGLGVAIMERLGRAAAGSGENIAG